MRFDSRKWMSLFSGSNKYWPIVHKDKYPDPPKKEIICNNCGERGHMRYKCRNPPKPKTCYMCGLPGHQEVRCPNTLCLKVRSIQTNSFQPISFVTVAVSPSVVWWEDQKLPTRLSIVCSRAEHDLPSVWSARSRSEKLPGQVAPIPFDGRYKLLCFLSRLMSPSASTMAFDVVSTVQMPRLESSGSTKAEHFMFEWRTEFSLMTEWLLPAIAMQGWTVFTVVVALRNWVLSILIFREQVSIQWFCASFYRL